MIVWGNHFARRCIRTSASPPSVANKAPRLVNDEAGTSERVHPEGRQARRRDHRSAGRLSAASGRERRHRPCARLGARHRGPMGHDGRALGRVLRHSPGCHLWRARNLRRVANYTRVTRPRHRHLLAPEDGCNPERASGRAGRRQEPAGLGRPQNLNGDSEEACRSPLPPRRDHTPVNQALHPSRRPLRGREAVPDHPLLRALRRQREADRQGARAAAEAGPGLRHHLRLRGRRAGRASEKEHAEMIVARAQERRQQAQDGGRAHPRLHARALEAGRRHPGARRRRGAGVHHHPQADRGRAGRRDDRLHPEACARSAGSSARSPSTC